MCHWVCYLSTSLALKLFTNMTGDNRYRTRVCRSPCYPSHNNSLTTILQCCSGLCHLQHGQQAFFRQNTAPSQIETHLRLKEARNEQGPRGRVVIRFGSLKLVLRYRLEAISKCPSLTKAIRRLVYIQVLYHYLKQILHYEGEATTLFQSSCQNNPTNIS